MCVSNMDVSLGSAVPDEESAFVVGVYMNIYIHIRVSLTCISNMYMCVYLGAHTRTHTLSFTNTINSEGGRR